MSPHAEEHAPTKNGEIVLLDYELWAEGGGRTDLIDTTREETAQQAKLEVPEGHRFAPQAHLIGGEYFPAGIEAALEGLKPGAEVEKEFAPAEAFGERDPKLIELFSMHEISRLPEMRREDAHLDLGTVLTIRGRRGRVVSLTAARVRVDFNPPFAGRKIRAKFRVVEHVHTPADQARAIVDLTYGHGPEFTVEVRDHEITLKVPERSKFDFAWVAAKPRVIDQLRTHLKPKTIRIVEEFVTPAPKKEADASQDAGKEASTPAPAETEKAAPAAKAGTKSASPAPKDG